MIEKLERRKRAHTLFSTSKHMKTSEIRHMHYIERKIKDHWKLKSTPKVCVIQDTSNFAKCVNLRKCDIKLCNKYVFRIPTDRRNLCIKAVNITNNIAQLQIINDALANIVYKRRDKYIYLLMDSKNQIQPVKKTTIINPRQPELQPIFERANVEFRLDDEERRRLEEILARRRGVAV